MAEESRRGPLPPTYFLAALLLQAALSFLVPVTRLVAAPWTWLGAIPAVAGMAVMIAGDRAFKTAKTAISPFDRPSSLVTTGVFGISRNPMYLGMVLTLVGAAIVWGTLAPLLVPWVFAWVVSYRFIRHEEAVLEDVFGDEYAAYRQRVRGWI